MQGVGCSQATVVHRALQHIRARLAEAGNGLGRSGVLETDVAGTGFFAPGHFKLPCGDGFGRRAKPGRATQHDRAIDTSFRNRRERGRLARVIDLELKDTGRGRLERIELQFQF